jgi:predicted nucleic acid-binding protein
MVILDTNVLSALIRQDPDPDPVIVSWLDRLPSLSVWTTSITVFEVRYGLATMPVGRRQAFKLAAFERFLEDDLEGRVHPFDHGAAEHAALLMEARHRAGRPRELRDTMIAGIALAQRATLATRNVRHFDDLSVPVVDPWQA